MASEEEILAKEVRTAGFRATTPRLAVLIFLKGAKYPLSIQRIAKAVGKKVDQVTVYRIVEAFAKAGLVSQSDLGEGRVYEYAGNGDHHHMVCTVCKRVWDFTDEGMGKLIQQALKQTRGFAEVKSHSLELFGLCKLCAAKI